MVAVDTNVLVHAVDRTSPFHLPSRALIERLRAGPSPWFVTWSILYEFVRVATVSQGSRRPMKTHAAWKLVESLLAAPTLRILTEGPRHAEVVRTVLDEVPGIAGRFVHDAHIAILMREHGLRRIYTRDRGFERFPFLEPVDPMKAAGAPGVAERAARYRASRRRAALADRA